MVSVLIDHVEICNATNLDLYDAFQGLHVEMLHLN